jgi:hypothetical protein
MSSRWATLALVAAAFPAGSAGTAQIDPLSPIVVPRSQLAELPGAFKIELLSGPTNNARAADDSFDPDDSAADLTRAGRVSGYTLFFGDSSNSALRRGHGLIDAGTTLDLFNTAAQARAFARKTRADLARVRGRNLDGVVLVSSTTFAVRGLHPGTIGLRIVTRVGSRRIYSTYVDFQVNRLLLEAAVSRADAVSSEEQATAVARALAQRVVAYATNKLRSAPLRLPRRPPAQQPVTGVPDLSRMVLRARDLGQGTTAVSGQGYVDDVNALASYSRQFRTDPRTGLVVVRSSVALERTAAEASGRLLVLRSIFTGPEGLDTVISGFAARSGPKVSRPSLDGVRRLSAADEAFSVSASSSTCAKAARSGRSCSRARPVRSGPTVACRSPGRWRAGWRPVPGRCWSRRAGGGTRTHGLLITNQLLYQLSYSGAPAPWYAGAARNTCYPVSGTGACRMRDDPSPRASAALRATAGA